MMLLFLLILIFARRRLKAAAKCLDTSCKVAFTFWFFKSIVPVYIPMRKDVLVPSFFDGFAGKQCLFICLFFFDSLLPFLDQNDSKIVDEQRSLFC